MFAKINGTRIFFDVEGMGWVPEGPSMKKKPVCFVLHGGPGGDHTGFKPTLSPLSDIMQLIYIDNRGSGQSNRGPQSSYTLENNIDDLEALREYLGLEKVVLLGHSYGGMVAQSFAVKYPDSVQGLILITTSPSYEFIEKAKKIVSEIGTQEQQEMAQLVWDAAFESNEQLSKYYQVMAPLYAHTHNIYPSEEEQLVALNARSRSNRSYEALNEGFGGFLRNYDVRDYLPFLKVSTLVIGGEYDWITPVSESYEINKLIPESELVIFKNSSHSVMKDEYDLFHSTVRSFVKSRIDGGGASLVKR
jgi:proline iminopeptidase